jgi:transcriptional regulator with XRE-family HTH domain
VASARFSGEIARLQSFRRANMEMKIDPQRIRQLREARGWSQEHLAEVAGLSARTVQRIEAEGKAAPESRMALAAAFGATPAELGAAPAAASLAFPAERKVRGWRRHALVYLLACGGMVLGNILTHGGITWSKWPLLGWGAGLLLHWLRWRAAPRVAG